MTFPDKYPYYASVYVTFGRRLWRFVLSHLILIIIWHNWLCLYNVIICSFITDGIC